MIGIIFSRHAQIRMQQRAIPPVIVEWILDYGCDMRHHGASVHFLDQEARDKLKREIGGKRYAQVENRLNAYVVVSDDSRILTVGWRYRRFKRPATRSKPVTRRRSHRRARKDSKRFPAAGPMSRPS